MPLDSGSTYQATIYGTGRQPIVPAYITWGDAITDPASALGSLTFDAILSEDHERTAVVTDHAVEKGSNIVDHVRPLPDRLSLEAFVSNSPITSADSQLLPLTLDLPQPGQAGFLAGGTGALLSKGLQAIGLQKGYPSSITAQVMQFSGETDYVRATYEQLTFLRDTATLLEVVTPQASYPNMVLERIGLHRDAQTGTSGTFSLEFRQIRVVSSKITDAPQPSIPRNAPSLSKGKKDAAAAKARMQSLAFRGGNALGMGLNPTGGELPQSP